MTQSVRVEFVKINPSGVQGVAGNVISELRGASVTLAVSNSATSTNSRPQAPVDGVIDAVRLTAIGNPVYVAWGSNPTASLTNSLRLAVEMPEIIVCTDAKFSFIAENA